jgi:hypothetical protein
MFACVLCAISMAFLLLCDIPRYVIRTSGALALVVLYDRSIDWLIDRSAFARSLVRSFIHSRWQ